MIITGSAVNADLTLSADVVVVGSGAGGAVFGKLLTDAGHDVLILEEGGYFTSQEFVQDEQVMYPRLYKDRGTQATEDQSITVLQGRCVGGSTVVNYLDCFRSPPRLLAEWREKAGLTDLTPEHLDPLWDEVEKILSVRQIGVEQLNPNNRKLHDGGKALGWKGDTFHRNALGCVGSGFCDLGCTYDAKQSMLLTYLPLASNGGARIHANCRVRRVLHEGDRAVGVEGEVLDPDTEAVKHLFTARGKLVVIAGGSINTPALLLWSGVTDPSKQIGQNLHLHPALPVVAEFDEEILSYHGIKQGYYISEFSAVLEGHPDDVLLEGIGASPGLTAPLFAGTGDEHAKGISRRNQMASAIALVRDLGGGSVTCGKNGKPIIRYQLDPVLDAPRAARGVENLMRAFLAAGARCAYSPTLDPVIATRPEQCAEVHSRPFGPNQVVVFSAHQMSTCRMGANDQTHPLSPQGLLWGYKNLMVCDASVFPTATGVNPQMTVYGMASHLADKVVREPGRYGL